MSSYMTGATEKSGRRTEERGVPSPSAVLERVTGGETVDPAEFNFSKEKGSELARRFAAEVIERTDVSTLLTGIVPAEAVFNPDRKLRQIESAQGPVWVENLNLFTRAVVDAKAKLLGVEAPEVNFDPINRVITTTNRLDGFSSLVAVAKGNFSQVAGPALAHEALHLHQAGERKGSGVSLVGEIRAALATKKSDPELSLTESIQALERSEDLAILTETQAYLLQYMLSGGSIQPERIREIRAEFRRDHPDTDETVFVREIPLTSYSEAGFPSVADWVYEKVKTYLPKKKQNRAGYQTRIKTATVQMIGLLDQGVSQRQIADLMAENYQAIQRGEGWSERQGVYGFLGKAVGGGGLIDKFNRQTEERLGKIQRIAKDLVVGNRS